MAKYPEIKSYIETNIEALKAGNGITKGAIPAVYMPCSKYCYLTEHEARKELARIAGTGDHKKPLRHYYCEKCGAYHLTSKELFGN